MDKKDNLTVTTVYGKIRGIPDRGMRAFLGIPYAKPPVGELRWRAPQRPEPWDGIYAANHYPNRSMQGMPAPDPEMMRQMEEMLAEMPEGQGGVDYQKEFYNDPVYETPFSEDSLYLNIWLPEEPADKPMPVAMWIHGGGFSGGTGHELEFRSAAYAAENVILVTINYRLNIFGFLAHPALTEEDPLAVGNYGLLDQIAALNWLHENIAAFGGDPENITIFGQSAGCMSVQNLVEAPAARGKFSRAVMQSGAGYPIVLQKEITLEAAYAYAEAAMEAVGVKTIDELRQVPAEVLLDKPMRSAMGGDPADGLILGPVDNHVFRPMFHDQMVESGDVAPVPTMIGTTRHDITVTPAEAADENGRLRKSCISWAQQMEAHGKPASYVYYFRRELPGDNAGAFHSAELWYMFGTLDSCWRPMAEGDYDLARRMVKYWTNFMKTGDPNGPDLPVWRPCTAADPFEMILDA